MDFTRLETVLLLRNAFFFSLGIIAASDKLGARLVLKRVPVQLMLCRANLNLKVSTTAEPWWPDVHHFFCYLRYFMLIIAMTFKNTKQPAVRKM